MEIDYQIIRARREAKIRVFKVDGNKCVWCEKETSLNSAGSLFATLEHLIPLSVGGIDDFENYAIACRECNTGRIHPPEINKLNYLLDRAEDEARLNRIFWCSAVKN